jgi:DNA-binding XRE family transcriptional regulator
MAKEKYTTHILPNLDKIREMAKTMTEEQMAKVIGVNKDTWFKYKREKPEFFEVLKKGRLDLCLEIKSVLIQRAKGMQVTEKKQIIEDGKVVREEIYTRSYPPDVAAASMLLKNYDPEWHNDDKATMELKKRQVEVMEKKAEDASWR